MPNQETFLEEKCTQLNEILKPFQKQLNQQLKMTQLVQQVMRAAGRDDFFQLDELLKSSIARGTEEEEGLRECQELFDELRAYADRQVSSYRIEFVEELEGLAEEAGLPVSVDFPRFQFLKGIDGNVDFAARRSTINKKTLRSVDPRRIISMAQKLKKQLYDGPYDPTAFVDGLHQAYLDVVKKKGSKPGGPAPMLHVYTEYVFSLQSKTFFQNMEKGRFKGYSVDQMAVDIWRYYQAGIGGTSDGKVMKLSPGRGNTLWLFDGQGERRLISSISFSKA